MSLRINALQTRNDIPLFVQQEGLTTRWAEVGVQRGRYSKVLLEACPELKEMYLVDAWKNLGEGYVDTANVSDAEHAKRLSATQVNLKPWEKKCRYMIMTSFQAAQRLRTVVRGGEYVATSFDFVYLDADHSYDAVKYDLIVWWELVRRGGILAGHDYIDGIVNNSNFGVKQAVTEFAHRRGIKVHRTLRNETLPSWIMRKEK